MEYKTKLPEIENLPSIDNFQQFYTLLANELWAWFTSVEENYYRLSLEKGEDALEHFQYTFNRNFQYHSLKLSPSMFFRKILDSGKIFLELNPTTQNFYFTEVFVRTQPKLNHYYLSTLEANNGKNDVFFIFEDYYIPAKEILFSLMFEYDRKRISEIHVSYQFTDGTDLDTVADNDPLFKEAFAGFISNYSGRKFSQIYCNALGIIPYEKRSATCYPLTEIKTVMEDAYASYINYYKDVVLQPPSGRYEFQDKYDDDIVYSYKIDEGFFSIHPKIAFPFYYVVVFEYIYNPEQLDSYYLGEPFDLSVLNRLMDEIIANIKRLLPLEEGHYLACEGRSIEESSIYLFSKDYKKPAELFDYLRVAYKENFKIAYRLSRDPYWETFTDFFYPDDEDEDEDDTED